MSVGTTTKFLYTHCPKALDLARYESDDSDYDSDSECGYTENKNLREAIFELQDTYVFEGQLRTMHENIYRVKSRKTGKHFVIKICALRKQEYQDQTSQEVRCLVKARGIPHVCQVEGWHLLLRDEFGDANAYAVVMPYYDKEPYDELTLEEIRRYMKQILTALNELKKRGVYHRDIKPSNIFWDGREATLMDFDCGKEDPEEWREGCVGTEGFFSPEMLKGTGYNYKTDVYALGVTFGLLLYGLTTDDAERDFVAFLKPKKKQNRQMKQKVKRYAKLTYKGDDDAKDLLLKMLLNDPNKRWDYERCLKHKFFEAGAASEATAANTGKCTVKPQMPLERETSEQ